MSVSEFLPVFAAGPGMSVPGPNFFQDRLTTGETFGVVWSIKNC